jgi:hypothetical protein
MTTSSSLKAPCRWSLGVHQVSRFAMAYGALAILLLAGGTTPAAAQQPGPPTANQIFARCVLQNTSTGNRINTVAGLKADILAANPSGTANKIQNPVIAYAIIYSVDLDNNGQPLVDRFGNPVGFTGPVICAAPGFAVTTALQTDDIPDIDILDLQDALILRHTPAGAAASVEDANRTCHTTDGNTQCFDIK